MGTVTPPTARLSSQASAAMRAAIRLAGGREVCFVCGADDEGTVQTARAVARGDPRSVLALPGFAKRGEMLVHNHPSGSLEPSDADCEIAARLHDDGIGFGITDNDARTLYVVVEIPREVETVPIDPAAIDADLGGGGPVAARLPHYEERAGQRAYARTIARLYNEGGIGLLEAGTGIGKSLGYLVPALRWAAANGERTVVSTNTINLQEQLVGKDLPFLASALEDQKVRFALLKGWRNYLCRYRLEQARGTALALFSPEMASDLEMLTAWADRTTDGSLSDLPAPPRPDVWDEVAAESDLCLRLQCPHYDKCFLFAARREAAQADVIVVNHHLLLSDVSVRRAAQNWEDAAVLPAYDRLVVDEGHHLEDAAAAHLGASVSRRALQRLFARLERRGGRGLISALIARLSTSRDLLGTASRDLVEEKIAPSARAARDAAEILFDALGVVLDERGASVVRLTDEFASHRVWRAGLGTALRDLLLEIAHLHEGLRIVHERLEGDTRRLEETAPLLNEMRGVSRRLEAAGDGLGAALQPVPGGAPTVRWIEVRGKERNLAVTAVPIDLAPILREDLFRRVRTTVVTSATLAAGRSFDFLATRLGLDEPDVRPVTAAYPSPFAFERQALLAIPTDVPPPNVDAAGHQRALLVALHDLAEAADGGLFALFTSHRDVRACAAELRARGAGGRWPLLVHGEDGRDALLRRFRDSGRSILLGTASFWEGVDVPGDALRALLIAKLPFKVPTDPLTAAHCEALERRGADAFREYMLPHAALRLKQGFGRLIRTATDHGAVVVTDPRIVTKAYGRELLAVLPNARRVTGTWADLRRDVQRFYRGVSHSPRHHEP